MSVRPVLLGLYEKYFLPLQKLLLPSLQAFVVGLLPGLEEGSEIYDRWVSARAQGRPPPGQGVPACVLFCCFVRNGGGGDMQRRPQKQGRCRSQAGVHLSVASLPDEVPCAPLNFTTFPGEGGEMRKFPRVSQSVGGRGWGSASYVSGSEGLPPSLYS